MDNKLRVSAKCITHGRTHFLEESLYSFLIQEYDDFHELIIVNDCPFQNLIFDHPKVKIFNFKDIFPTIGEKENFAIEQCSGDLIAVFDDDDIALSNHLSNIKKFWKEDTNLLHWQKGAFYNDPNITSITGLGNSGIIYSKKAWLEIGKSPVMNAGGDTVLVNSLHSLGRNKVVNASPPDNEISWFYRWSLPQNGGVYHQSGLGFDDGKKPNVVERNAIYVRGLRNKGLIPEGDIYLKPHWDKDYKSMLEKYIKTKK